MSQNVASQLVDQAHPRRLTRSCEHVCERAKQEQEEGVTVEGVGFRAPQVPLPPIEAEPGQVCLI
jgi:hypothetical protein